MGMTDVFLQGVVSIANTNRFRNQFIGMVFTQAFVTSFFALQWILTEKNKHNFNFNSVNVASVFTYTCSIRLIIKFVRSFFVIL